MGYSLIIGEKIFNDKLIWAEGVVLKNAPAFGEPTDNSNQRWPRYSTWHNFCEATDLYNSFYENNEFRGGHPGYFEIDKNFKNLIDLALLRWKNLYPEAEPKISPDKQHNYLMRLVWLKFWTDWALKNCENPILANS